MSNGAISFYLDHFVKTRVSKVTYGYFCHIPYVPSDPDHVCRVGNSFISIAGEKRLSNSFDVILSKVCIRSLNLSPSLPFFYFFNFQFLLEHSSNRKQRIPEVLLQRFHFANGGLQRFQLPNYLLSWHQSFSKMERRRLG